MRRGPPEEWKLPQSSQPTTPAVQGNTFNAKPLSHDRLWPASKTTPRAVRPVGELQPVWAHHVSGGYAVTWGGRVSCPERGDIAAGAATRAGATPLEALIVGHTASFGSPCFLKDRQQADLLVQRNGRHPHPRSVARARRNATRKGFLHVQRVLPFQKPKGARHHAGPGTTTKVVIFGKGSPLGVRDPMTRGQRKRAQQRENAAAAEQQQQPVGPRLFGDRLVAAATPRPAPASRQYVDEFTRMAAPAVEAATRREEAWQQAADERMLASVPKRPRAPPDG